MQKLLIGIVVVIAVVSGIVLLTGNTQAPAENNTQTQEGNTDNTNTGSETGSNTNGNVEIDVSVGSPAATITYTDAGYSPASVTIKKGQTVRWINNSASKTWPASAVHPTHAAYPVKSASDCLGSSFDACRGLSQGESWDFTFNEVGTWKYHNHLKASNFGTVVVTN